MMTPSLSYRIIRKLFAVTGMRQQLSLSTNEFIEEAKKINAKRKFQMPKDKKNGYLKHTVDHCPVLEIRPGNVRHDHALLFIYGGGMTTAPDGGDQGYAINMAEKINRDVYFPYYPLCPEHSVRELTEMVLHTYRLMLKNYRPENIALFGFSSGGATALSTLLMINDRKLDLPMPGKLVAVSAGSVPASEEEKAAMMALDEKDFVCPASYMMEVGEMMKGPETEIEPYLLSAHLGDFTNFPETRMYYGGDEVLSACAPYYEAALTEYNVKHHITIEPYMCHCYADFRFTPECRKGNDEILAFLKA